MIEAPMPSTQPNQSTRPVPRILPLGHSMDPALVGGKAAGLSRLIPSGFQVPDGICVTTEVYKEVVGESPWSTPATWNQLLQLPLHEGANAFAREHQRIESMRLPPVFLEDITRHLSTVRRRSGPVETISWAVRSSATCEDGAQGSCAGIFQTTLGVSAGDLPRAVIRCWASLWTPAAFRYYARVGLTHPSLQMAVIIQRLLCPKVAGIANSQHPVTGDPDVVAINAVPGLAESLVAGQATPEAWLVGMNRREGRAPAGAGWVVTHMPGDSTSESPDDRPLPNTTTRHHSQPDTQLDPLLSDREVMALADTVKKVESAFHTPVDVEWAIDQDGVWLLQARPVAPPVQFRSSKNIPCAWSRANFKETLPEVPSPLALDYLVEFMENIFITNYREVGCDVPDGMPAVRIIQGRPYINVTLHQILMAQLGSDPHLLAEHLGGPQEPIPAQATRKPLLELLRIGCRLQWRIWRASQHAPARFAALKRSGTIRGLLRHKTVEPREMLNQVQSIRTSIQQGDLTFAIVCGVSQALFALESAMQRRFPSRWRALLNAASQGAGGIISANQILWLVKLAEKAQSEDAVVRCLLADPWEPQQVMAQLQRKQGHTKTAVGVTPDWVSSSMADLASLTTRSCSICRTETERNDSGIVTPQDC